MDVNYRCFCQTMCETFNELLTHKLSCEFLHNTSSGNEMLDRMSLTSISRPTVLEDPLRKEAEIKLKFVKTWIIFLERGQLQSSNKSLTTNILGRKLPKRTKVPYLSRATPLSSDHSYERCTCGAVFATRLGKRQHQARFCKLVKNKSKKPRSNGSITEDSKTNAVFQFSDLNGEPVTCIDVIKKELSNIQQQFLVEEIDFEVDHL